MFTIRPVQFDSRHLTEVVINLNSYPTQDVPGAFTYVSSWSSGNLSQLYAFHPTPNFKIETDDGCAIVIRRLDGSFKTVDYSFNSRPNSARKGSTRGKTKKHLG